MSSSLLPRNEGSVDRLLRVVAGLVLVGVALAGVSPWGWIGLIPLVTGVVGTCPLYMAFGLNTCPADVKGG
ncbi:MAG TPA: DUF2892 domain-containing protein [Myxococcota bacterium]|nr:DUF2892 domain-containing protein [Myxococcota bacterium]